MECGIFEARALSIAVIFRAGDDWHVALVCEGRVFPQVPLKWWRCVAGACAAPLEDSGGIDEYYDTLAARTDRRHPMHQDAKDWVPKRFDPAHFEPREVVVSDPRRRLKALLARLDNCRRALDRARCSN